MIGLQQIQEARAAIAPSVERTPLRESFFFSDACGFDVFLKCENCQPTGSFKIRGALNLIRTLSPAERLAGAVAWSAGNHALGVAYAAKIFDMHATIFVPRKTPATKLQRLQYYAVEVCKADTYEDAERQGRAFAKVEGAHIIHPYDDWRTVAGQGTIGIELHEQMPELDAIVVPVGGGGLISGIAIAIKALDPDIKIIACQSSASPALKKSLQDKHCYEEFPVEFSIAEGLAGGIGKIVYELAPKYIDQIIIVDEDAIRTAVAQLVKHEQMIVEASGAITMAALPQIECVPRGSRVAAVLSGGNLDMRLLKELLPIL
jgi:threonine dehydratase